VRRTVQVLMCINWGWQTWDSLNVQNLSMELQRCSVHPTLRSVNPNSDDDTDSHQSFALSTARRL
jgi:hypothetical protein